MNTRSHRRSPDGDRILAEHRPAARSARDVLEERYARGAIERDEFEARKRLLGE